MVRSLVLSIFEKEVTPSLAQATLAMVDALHVGNNVQAVASITPYVSFGAIEEATSMILLLFIRISSRGKFLSAKGI